MGKCKRRTLNKTNTSYFMTRESAVNSVFKMMEDTRKNNRKKHTKRKSAFSDVLSTISLFGISAEELSEAGVAYENLKALSSVLN